MKTLWILSVTIATLFLASGMNVSAQTGELTVIIRGVKEAKGRILISAGDRSNPGEMISTMVAITNKDSIVCVLKNVPPGKVGLYAFQDLNENYKLDMDERQIPIEPCYSKEKVSVGAGENRIEIRLIDVKEMMGTKSEE